MSINLVPGTMVSEPPISPNINSNPYLMSDGLINPTVEVAFLCVVQTQKPRSNKIYKTELTKIRYKIK